VLNRRFIGEIEPDPEAPALDPAEQLALPQQTCNVTPRGATEELTPIELTANAAREASIARHLTQLRHEVPAGHVINDDDFWFLTENDDTDQLIDEHLAQFDTLEDTRRITAEPKDFVKPILFTLLGLAVVAAVFSYFVFFSGGFVTVPDLIGLTTPQATEQLEEAGLTVGRVLEQENANVAPGVVLAQDPRVDRSVPRGSPVTLTVARESRETQVPDLTGLTPEEAREILTANRLVLEEVVTYDPIVPDGEILGQLPLGDSYVPAGSTVAVLVVKGSPTVPVPMPRVMGLSANDAETVLVDAGFTPLVYFGSAPFGRIDEVVIQTPSTGTLIMPGSPVQYLVSRGSSTTDVAVPNVVGMRVESATIEIENAGFEVVTYLYVDSETPQGVVVAQMPIARDALIKAGESVGLLISNGSDNRATVPDVLGMTQLEAYDELRTQGFRPVTVTLPTMVLEGVVRQQFPRGGTESFIGLPVLLYTAELDE